MMMCSDSTIFTFLLEIESELSYVSIIINFKLNHPSLARNVKEKAEREWKTTT